MQGERCCSPRQKHSVADESTSDNNLSQRWNCQRFLEQKFWSKQKWKLFFNYQKLTTVKFWTPSHYRIRSDIKFSKKLAAKYFFIFWNSVKIIRVSCGRKRSSQSYGKNGCARQFGTVLDRNVWQVFFVHETDQRKNCSPLERFECFLCSIWNIAQQNPW